MQMPSRKPAVILLDALGTLVGLEPPAPRLRAELAERFGLAVSEDQAAAAIAAEIAYYRAHLDEGRDRSSLGDLRRRCAEALRSALPAPAGELELDRVVPALLASLSFRVFPDVRPALEVARLSGHRLVVVSNWDVSLHDVLRGLGVTPLLDGVLTSAEAGVRKPAPAIFEQALALAGATPDEAIHVGDSLREDVAGALAVGIEPVLVRRDAREGAVSRAGVAGREGAAGWEAVVGREAAVGREAVVGRDAVAGVRTISSLTELAEFAVRSRS
jgi:putative hydrolase of the HAD superfamily